MIKLKTYYYLPDWWRHPWMRWYRTWKLLRWRQQGFKVFAERRDKHLVGYDSIPCDLGYVLRQGTAFAFIKRTRGSGQLILTKPQVSDAALTGMVG